MNLQKLFDTQAKLDAVIMDKHPELKEQENLDWKLLALQVELGECANEWRGFKKWSNDQEPRTDKLLEEYVDCLHFILSIGLELDIQSINFEVVHDSQPVDDAFMEVMAHTADLYWLHRNGASDEQKDSMYGTVIYHLMYLSHTLGFAWEQVEAAYYSKNAVNHNRQDNNY